MKPFSTTWLSIVSMLALSPAGLAHAQAVCTPAPPYLGTPSPEICVELRETPSGAVQTFRGPTPLSINVTGFGEYDVAMVATYTVTASQLTVTLSGAATRSSAGTNGLAFIADAGQAAQPLTSGFVVATVAGTLLGGPTGSATVQVGASAGYDILGIGDPQWVASPVVATLTFLGPGTLPPQTTNAQAVPVGATAVRNVTGIHITNVGDTMSIPSAAGVGDDPAAPVSLELIADTNTPVPGGIGNFTSLGVPAIDGDDVGFSVSSGPSIGVYKRVGGTLQMVANGSTPIPGGSGFFDFIGAADFSDGHVVFQGTGSGGQWGVYSDVSETLDVIADKNTPVPNDGSNFVVFGELPSISNDEIAFYGFGNVQAGIYKWSNSTLSMAADFTTPPLGGGSFTSFRDPDIESGDIAFTGATTLGGFLFEITGGVITTVADTSTPIPGGIGTFVSFEQFPDYNGGNVAGLGLDATVNYGVYVFENGIPKMIADKNTPIPNGAGNFTQTTFMRMGADHGVVAFVGFGADQQRGIYVYANGKLRKLVDRNDSFDGHPFNSFALRRYSVEGNKIAFFTTFADGSGSAMFIATLDDVGPVSVPSIGPFAQTLGALILLATGAARLMWRRADRRFKRAIEVR